MKKIGLICATALVGMSLTACGSQSSKNANTPTKVSSSKVVKRHKKQSSKSSVKKSSSLNNSANSQSTTQQSNANHQTQASAPSGNTSENGNDNQGQDKRPDDVPDNFKEYVSYTTDGHRMTQWNDAGQYEGDPDVQYQTIKAQTDEGY